MRILSVGNSFSLDAQRYLHGVAKAQGLDIDTGNLGISGCALARHHQNMITGEKAYKWRFNGFETGLMTTLEDGLLAGTWDVITLQQASLSSPFYETYQPYLQELASYVRTLCPTARLVIHQTWAYEDGSERLVEKLKYNTRAEMLRDIVSCYDRAAEDIHADGLIPSGQMMYLLQENGIEKVHRDTFHAALGVGRYALALLWLRMLCGVSVTGNGFSDFDVPVSEYEREIAWRTVDAFEPIRFPQS